MIAELPLKNVKFDLKLNAIGSFTADLPLGQKVLKLPFAQATQPSRTAIWIDRNGVLVWGGILWTRTYDSTTETLKLAGQDFGSYFQHSYIVATQAFAGVDELLIAKDLLQYLQGKTGGNIGVQYMTPYPNSGITRTQTYNGYEFREGYQTILELSQLDSGFDFGFDANYVGGVPTITFNPSYPHRGYTQAQAVEVFELPGRIIDYTYEEDGTRMATTAYATGQGYGTSVLQASASTTPSGYPLLEMVDSYKSQNTQAEVTARATADAAAFGAPVALYDLTLLGGDFIGSAITGDDVRVRITDKRFNKGVNADGSLIGPGLDAFVRVVSFEVTPGDDTAETVKATLGAPI